MPKKKHRIRHWKPQGPSPNWSASAASGSDTVTSRRSVNELLANLRRAQLSLSSDAEARQRAAAAAAAAAAAEPSTPPAIRQILQLPVTPLPIPRQPARVDSSGRRLPPGPPPPRSGFIQQRLVTSVETRAAGSSGPKDGWHRSSLPDAYEPAPGSLVQLTLRKLAEDWEFQREYCRYYLHALPSHLRAALMRYIGSFALRRITRSDLEAVLVPPADLELVSDGGEEITTLLNNDFYHLDLASSVGVSLTVRQLSELLFPAQSTASHAIQDSWDATESTTLSPQLLPNITHLSLATENRHSPNSSCSWRQLLTLASKLPTLTHLSLANWPLPSLTPNATYSTVVTQQGLSVQYGGTGPYSHSLDDDWSEAALVLRKLSRALYSLEYLDLTGCADWWESLSRIVDGVSVDWTKDWGKVNMLILRLGDMKKSVLDAPPGTELSSLARTASVVEKHITTQRAGKGRFITVDRDDIFLGHD